MLAKVSQICKKLIHIQPNLPNLLNFLPDQILSEQDTPAMNHATGVQFEFTVFSTFLLGLLDFPGGFLILSVFSVFFAHILCIVPPVFPYFSFIFSISHIFQVNRVSMLSMQ